VTPLSTTHSDVCLTRVSKRHKQQAKTRWQQRRVGGRTASGIKAHDPSCVRLSPLWQHIKDLIWTTLLIGTGVSAFTTGDMWVIPSILLLLWVSATTFRRLLVAVIGI
jgi:hypothetical protein